MTTRRRSVPTLPTAAKAPEPRLRCGPAPVSLHSRPDFVVALGASAGGLEALQDFFSALDPEQARPAAFIVVQHLSPDHKSMMPDLLTRSTCLPINVIEEGMPLVAGQVFLIPPSVTLRITPAGRFALRPKTPGVVSLPIDILFSSMAEVFKNNCIGVVLSGTGSDGTRGVVAINSVGGLTLAQTPSSAQFDGMPRSAIATGYVDEQGDARQLARRVLDYLHGQVPEPVLLHAPDGASGPDQEGYRAILEDLSTRTAIPFDQYKQSTVVRRIHRRMTIRHCASLTDYAKLLRGDPAELQTLRREVLIGVTRFFRDGPAFDELAKLLPDLLAHKAKGEALRIWSAGCSTGEEAYSLAILVHEAMQAAGLSLEVKIFATDVVQDYLDVASAGLYPATIEAELSPQRLEACFVRQGEMYRISPAIRRMVIFARHNVITDAPFTKVDLLVCRNTLIYFEASLQEKVIKRFQYALTDGGILFLGSSESLGPAARDFMILSSKNKIFRTLRPGALSLEALQIGRMDRALHVVSRPPGVADPATPMDRIKDALIDTLLPPSILLTETREIAHVFGDVSRFLRLPKGQATLDPARMMAPGASATLLQILAVARRDRAPVFSAPIALGRPADGPVESFRIRAAPVAHEAPLDQLMVVTFLPVQAPTAVPDPADAPEVPSARIEMLEGELAITREHLQSTIEELEAANEELQAANEELLASNEELQSTNEELQSVNEELYTVNSEYQEKIQLLVKANADLDLMARAAAIPTIFVDSEIVLTRFTPDSRLIYDFRDTDIGRPLGDFSNKIGYATLPRDLGAVVQQRSGREVYWRTRDGTDYLIRMMPYSDGDGAVLGAVVAFIDITKLNQLESLQNLIDSLPEHLAVLDGDGNIQFVNSAWTKFAAANEGDADRVGVGTNYFDACVGAVPRDRYAAKAAAGLRAVLSGGIDHFSLRYPCHSPTEKRWFLMHAAPLQGSGGGAVVSHINITSLVGANEEEVESHEA